MYEIEENVTMKNKRVEMNCDDLLCDCMNRSIQSLARSFNMVLVGRPGSGKTNFLINLLKNGQMDGERRGLKKMFHNIAVCSPSISSLKNNILRT